MGQNGAAFGQLPHVGPFPLEKISKRGAKKVENQLSPNILFKPQDVGCHKGSPPVLFWDEKRPCLGRGGLLCGNSVPKFELYFCPDHRGGPFGPKLHEPSSYIIQTWFASKKSHFRTFAQLTPSGIIVYIRGCSVQFFGSKGSISWKF